jgi:hypothetical protein
MDDLVLRSAFSRSKPQDGVCGVDAAAAVAAGYGRSTAHLRATDSQNCPPLAIARTVGPPGLKTTYFVAIPNDPVARERCRREGLRCFGEQLQRILTTSTLSKYNREMCL